MPSQGTSSPDVGNLSIFAADFEKELNTPIGGGYTFSMAPQFNFRSWGLPFRKPPRARFSATFSMGTVSNRNCVG